MTYPTTPPLPNSCGPMADGPFRDPKGRSYPHPKYWTHRWRIHINIDHGISPIDPSYENQAGHMTYHTTTLLPNSCDPMADGPFRDPKGRSYPHLKYWTHRWRSDINIDHGISPIEPRSENQGTWHIIRRHYCQIAAAQWRMVHMGPQGSVLSSPQILDPSMKDWYQYRPWNLTHRAQLREAGGHMTYHTTALLPNSCGPMADGPFRDPKGRSYPHPKYWTHRCRIDINIDHGISPIEPS